MKKYLLLLTGSALFMPFSSSALCAAADENNSLPEQIITLSTSAYTITEGESFLPEIIIDPEYADRTTLKLQSTRNTTYIAPDGTVFGYERGGDVIQILAYYQYGSEPYDRKVYFRSMNVVVEKNESLPAETKEELERLSKSGEFQRRRMELLGAASEDAPRLTRKQAEEIRDSMGAILKEKGADAPAEIQSRLNTIAFCPDYDGGASLQYWLDAKGSEVITYNTEDYSLICRKIHPDGTVIGIDYLYPESLSTESFDGITEQTALPYVWYHQLPYSPVFVDCGDANEDGVCNLADAASLRNYLTGSVSRLDETHWYGADMNNDMRISVVDLTLLKQKLLEQSSV